jgi:membrane-associated phospholipid phosphatase
MRTGGSRGASLSAALALGALVLGAVASPSPAFAQAPRPHQLKYDVALDATVIGLSAAFVIGTELVKVVKPQRCRWCDRSDGEDRLNGLDRWAKATFRWRDPRQAQFDSGVTAFLLEPAFATVDMIVVSAADDADRAFPVDLLIITEAVAFSTFLNQATKLLIARERPFVHGLPAEERTKTALPSDNNVSFYSGHTSMTFSLAAAAGTVASLRGYRLMPLVWATLMPLAAATGYLRMGADKHYFSDVLVGAVVGAAVGVAMPLLFHGRQGDNLVPIGSGGDGIPATGSISAPLRGPPTPMVTLGGGF